MAAVSPSRSPASRAPTRPTAAFEIAIYANEQYRESTQSQYN